MTTHDIHGNGPTSADPAQETVSVALEQHHHRLDDMLDRIEIDVEVGSWGEARRKFSLFRRELEEHMRLEEEILLADVGSEWQVNYGPPAVVRGDHARIRDLLDVVEVGLENEHPMEETTDALEAVLAEHNAKEEHLLYPMFERLATPEAYAAATFELRPLIKGQDPRVPVGAPADLPVPRDSLLHIHRSAAHVPVP
jgi:iron-sulfur cluster repair protein YtfE (RIC family)